MFQGHDDWLNDSAAYENFVYGLLPRENEAKIERELDELKERDREADRDHRKPGGKIGDSRINVVASECKIISRAYPEPRTDQREAGS